MVGHADTGVYSYLIAVGGLNSGCLLPGLLYLFAERSEGQGFVAENGHWIAAGFVAENGRGIAAGIVTEIGHEMGKQVGAAAHYQRDEVGAATIVVVAWIAGTVGGWHTSAYLVRQ